MVLLLSGCSLSGLFMPSSSAEPDTSETVQPSESQSIPGTAAPTPSTAAPAIPTQPSIGLETGAPTQTVTPVTPGPSSGLPQQINWDILTVDEKFEALEVTNESRRSGVEALTEVRYGSEKSTRRFQTRMKADTPKEMSIANLVLDDGFVNFIAADSENASNFVSVDAYKFQWSESSYEGNLSIQCCFDTEDHRGLLLLFCKAAASFGYQIDMDGVMALADDLFLSRDKYPNYRESKFGQNSGDTIFQIAVLNTAAGKTGVSIVISESIQSEGGENDG